MKGKIWIIFLHLNRVKITRKSKWEVNLITDQDPSADSFEDYPTSSIVVVHKLKIGKILDLLAQT